MSTAFLSRPSTRALPALIPGIALAIAIGLVATAAGSVLPLIGAPVIAILVGVICRSMFAPNASLSVGIRFSAKSLLQVAVVLSGFALSVSNVVATSLKTMPVTLATITVAFVLAPIIGRMLRLDATIRQLIGVGTAICGASAIAAVSAAIEPEEADLAVSIATIFLYNIAAVLLFPTIGHVMQLTQAAFGVWAGTAINDTSSVVAAGYIYGHAAGHEATIVKLSRATLILPIVAFIAIKRARGARATESNEHRVAWQQIVPWFIVWFLVAAVINSTGVIPVAMHPILAFLSVFLITTALAAIGLQTHWRTIARAGIRPLTLGFVLWVAVAVTSLVVERFTGLL